MPMTCSAVYALMTLAFLAVAAPGGCYGELGRVRLVATVPLKGDGDVVVAGWFGHAWHCKAGI